jgi:hypothetical protein
VIKIHEAIITAQPEPSWQVLITHHTEITAIIIHKTTERQIIDDSKKNCVNNVLLIAQYFSNTNFLMSRSLTDTNIIFIIPIARQKVITLDEQPCDE